jgi:hypothetical protein
VSSLYHLRDGGLIQIEQKKISVFGAHHKVPISWEDEEGKHVGLFDALF